MEEEVSPRSLSVRSVNVCVCWVGMRRLFGYSLGNTLLQKEKPKWNTREQLEEVNGREASRLPADHKQKYNLGSRPYSAIIMHATIFKNSPNIKETTHSHAWTPLHTLFLSSPYPSGQIPVLMWLPVESLPQTPNQGGLSFSCGPISIIS